VTCGGASTAAPGTRRPPPSGNLSWPSSIRRTRRDHFIFFFSLFLWFHSEKKKYYAAFLSLSRRHSRCSSSSWEMGSDVNDELLRSLLRCRWVVCSKARASRGRKWGSVLAACACCPVNCAKRKNKERWNAGTYVRNENTHVCQQTGSVVYSHSNREQTCLSWTLVNDGEHIWRT
jgi:hypothetical protein